MIKNILITSLLLIIGTTISIEITQFTTDEYPGLCSNNLRGLSIDSLGNIWVGRWDVWITSEDYERPTVSMYDGMNWRSWSPISTDFELCFPCISDIETDQNGRIWIATGLGTGSRDTFSTALSYFERGEWHRYGMEDGLPSFMYCDLEFDSDGYLWASRSDGNIDIFDGSDWASYDHRDGLGLGQVTDFWFDTSDGIWFDVPLDPYLRYFNTIRTDSILLDTTGVDTLLEFGLWVYSVCMDDSGNFWIGANNGVHYMDRDTVIRLTLIDGFPVDRCFGIDIDSDGNIWSVFSRYVLVYNGDSTCIIDSTDGFPGSFSFTELKIDNLDCKWIISTGEGVIMIEGNVFAVYENIAKEDEVNDIIVYPNPFIKSCEILRPEGIDVKIYDVKGQLVSRLEPSNNCFKPEDCLATGMYLAVINNKNRIIKKKLLYTK